MSPSATSESQQVVLAHKGTNGRALERVADGIEELNRARADIRDLDTPSKFDANKDKSKFRQYEEAANHVKEFYREQHLKQTYAFNIKVRKDFAVRKRTPMTVWEAMEMLDKYVDQSDPDTDVGQIEHLLQSAEATRRDQRQRWFQFTTLIHDVGKLWGKLGAEGQWDVVGDTFPVGCEYSKSIQLYDSLKDNPDYNNPEYNTKFGVYEEGCGLDKLLMSWGHDECLYQIVKDQSNLPEEALYIIRYHSFYPWHSEQAYTYFMNEADHRGLAAVKAFNAYDLYSKDDAPPNVEELKPYYMDLINEFMPGVIYW
ncbi:hypothetical protein MFRU_014g01880 [Monilinia fructicola]|uniref:Inositol oxygenase n=1 Tax=Monilinia fructicola TaxID=38448 RepID=A0A5M9K4C1_MONFR|nr:hypothetical protein EYC84_006742 [Monilinia fructicola]KAG4029895.1 hypothetical protein MFRU_014g01880 [Monilinia fructicola]